MVPKNIHIPPRRELEILRGWGEGGSETQEIPEGMGGGGVDNKITFQGVNFKLSTKIATYQSGRSF